MRDQYDFESSEDYESESSTSSSSYSKLLSYGESKSKLLHPKQASSKPANLSENNCNFNASTSSVSNVTKPVPHIPIRIPSVSKSSLSIRNSILNQKKKHSKSEGILSSASTPTEPKSQNLDLISQPIQSPKQSAIPPESANGNSSPNLQSTSANEESGSDLQPPSKTSSIVVTEPDTSTLPKQSNAGESSLFLFR